MATRRPHPSNGAASENDTSVSPPKKMKKGKSPPVVDMLKNWAKDFGCSLNDLVFARSMDSRDTLKELRKEFMMPKMQDLPSGKWSINLVYREG